MSLAEQHVFKSDGEIYWFIEAAVYPRLNIADLRSTEKTRIVRESDYSPLQQLKRQVLKILSGKI